MPEKTQTFIAQLLGEPLGALLCALFAIQLIARPARTREWAPIFVSIAGLAWFAGGVLERLITMLGESTETLIAVAWAGRGIAAVLAPGAILHLGLRLSGRPRLGRYSAMAYLLIPLSWWLTGSAYRWLFAAALGATIVLLGMGSIRESDAVKRRFLQTMAVGFAVLLCMGAVGPSPESKEMVLGVLAPTAGLGYFGARYHVYGLAITRRIVFVAAMSAFSAVYLWITIALVNYVERSFEQDVLFAPALRLILVFGISLFLWVPLYGWMNRVLSERGRVYADFGKRLLEEAASILDLRQRLEFIAREVGRTFRLRSVLVAATDEDGTEVATFGQLDTAARKLPVSECAERIRQARLDAPAGPRLHSEYLEGTGFTYLFPLWYEHRLVGLLYLDTAPRLHLGDDETILLGLTRQISHSIESCRQIQRQIDLEKALAHREHLATLGQLAATIAHEVKNPLSSIKTLGQLMQEDPDLKEQHHRDLSFIVSETNRLDVCVRQLLNYARPTRGTHSSVVLAEMLGEIARVLALDSANSGVQIEYNAPVDLVMKQADVPGLHQIVLNLALNAVQASPAMGRVEMRACTPEPGKIAITVSDEGPGIPLQIRQKIFEPFFTTKQKGSGLGLAIVVKNTRQLGGEVRVESPVNGSYGTAFTVVFPEQKP